MKPTFPGMNPYLEDPDLWPEVHSWLIVLLARSLNPQLTPKYRAAIEKRVYTDSLLVGIPDVSIFQTQDSNTPKRATATLSQPVKVNVPAIEEIQESYLEIRRVGTGQVVTVIELPSPKNKRAGEGRDQYNLKRRKVLSSLSHLVEIDLLRAGEPQPMSSGVASDYRVLVSRSDCRPEAELYPFDLTHPIPRFPLPLQAGDPEPVVDLKTILDTVYDEAALSVAIDYSQQPIPPLPQPDFEWIQTLVDNE
jgi:vacuolar-type H+-ATPase subunit F/Vma7